MRSSLHSDDDMNAKLKDVGSVEKRSNSKTKPYKKPAQMLPTKRKLEFTDVENEDATPAKAFRAQKLRDALQLDSPASSSKQGPGGLPVKTKPTAAKSRPKGKMQKARKSSPKKPKVKASPKSGSSPCAEKPKAKASPKSCSSPSAKKPKVKASPKSRSSPSAKKPKVKASPKSRSSPSAKKPMKAISPKSGGSMGEKKNEGASKLGMKSMVMKKMKGIEVNKGSKDLKMTRRNIYSRAYHAIYQKEGGTKKKAGETCITSKFKPPTSFIWYHRLLCIMVGFISSLRLLLQACNCSLRFSIPTL